MKTKKELIKKKANGKHPGGRPGKDWTAIRRDLLQMIATSNKSLQKCLNEINPKYNEKLAVITVFDWIHDDKEFAKQYARAKEDQADFLAEEILSIADDTSEDEIFIEAEDGSGQTAKRICNKEFIARSRLRVDTRKWIASKLKPKKYGDKVDVTSGDKPLEGATIINLSPIEKATRIAFILQRAIDNKKAKLLEDKKEDKR
jgi:hypothetical protein